MPRRSTPPADDGIRRCIRSIRSSSRIRNDGWVFCRRIILAHEKVARRDSGSYVMTLGYDFWKVPGTNGQLADFSPIAQVAPPARSAKIWLTPETVFSRLASLSDQDSRSKVFQLSSLAPGQAQYGLVAPAADSSGFRNALMKRQTYTLFVASNHRGRVRR